jgi:hypothetical protein
VVVDSGSGMARLATAGKRLLCLSRHGCQLENLT